MNNKHTLNPINLWVKIRRGKLLKKIYKFAFKLAGKVLPVNDKLMILESFLGKQYSDNPRAIYEYVKENYPEIQMHWSVDRPSAAYFKDNNIPHVRRFTVKWLFLMTRARYWITNSRLPLWITKPDHTLYLQTWHGTPLKRLASDMETVKMPGTNTKKYKRNFLKEANRWDFLVSPNAYSTEIFRRAFDFEKTVLEVGYPRNDYLFTHNNELEINKIKDTHNLPKDKKIVLYAPTWRDNQYHHKGKYRFDLELDLQRMREKLGKEYIVILRLHYLIADNLDISNLDGFAYDFSKHEDIRELYLISDILITDYSSVFFDYANLKRPILFYVYDLEDYRDNLRGFYFNFENKAPGPLLTKTDEIIEQLTALDSNSLVSTKNYTDFFEKFCYLEDGKATERLITELIKKTP